MLIRVFSLFFLFQWILQFHVVAQERKVFFNHDTTSVTYSADIFSNLNGGLETGTRFMDKVDVKLGFEAKGISFYFYGLGNQGKSISEIVGDKQVVSNIDTKNSWRLYEAWAEKIIPTINSSILVGLYDLNSEFDKTNTGSLFLNSSHGIGPDFSSSGITGPSIFPLTSLSARLKVHLFSAVSFKFAVLDGVPSDPDNTIGTSLLIREKEGALLVSELIFSKFNGQSQSRFKRGLNTTSPYRLVFGGWKYSKEREGWLGTSESDHGVYSIFELSLGNGLSFYGRTGLTNRDINRYNGYFGGGITYSGLIKKRENDQIGIGFANAFNSDDFVRIEKQRGNNFSNDELNIEFTYLFVVSNQVSFQFDSQYIRHPNQAPGIDNTLVIGLRSVFGF